MKRTKYQEARVGPYRRLGTFNRHIPGRPNYYVTFIDDLSCKVWVYFLKNKSDVFDVFKNWKAMVENESDLKVKTL